MSSLVSEKQKWRIKTIIAKAIAVPSLKQQQQHQKLYLHDHKGITVLQKLLV